MRRLLLILAILLAGAGLYAVTVEDATPSNTRGVVWQDNVAVIGAGRTDPSQAFVDGTLFWRTDREVFRVRSLGTWRDWLTVPAWDDLRFPASGINPPGAASDPGRSTTTALLEFSGTQDNLIAGVAQMPHAWATGTPISPHLHLRFPTSATCNTRWKLETDMASASGDFTNNSGTYTDRGTITVANPTNVKKHELADFSDLTMTGYGISTNVTWRITRLASSDAADNCTAVVELLEFDIHYEIDSFGSGTEYVK